MDLKIGRTDINFFDKMLNCKVYKGAQYTLGLDSNGNEYYELSFCFDYTAKTTDDGLFEFVIPSYIDGIPVKTIGPFCFSNRYVNKIKIPEGVVSIDKYAFIKCKYLKELEFPSSIKKFEPSPMLTAKINIRNDTQSIPSSLVGYPGVDFFQKGKLLKTLSFLGNVDGVVWYHKYVDDSGYEKISWNKLIDVKSDGEYLISLNHEQKYFIDNNIEFEVNDLEKFNKLIYLLYPTINDIPTPVPEFSKLFTNYKELTNIGLDIQILYDNPNIVFKSFYEIFDNIYNNFSSLSLQNNITSNEMLQKIYFGYTFDSREDLFRKLQESIRNSCKIEPTTVIQLMDDSNDDFVKQKLRDSLVYASHIVPLNVDNIDNRSMVELREIIAHDGFENISKSNDEVYKEIYGLYPKRYSLFENDKDLFEGAHYHIRKDLERINLSFYNINSEINLSPTEISEFLKTLSTIKNWDKLSTDKKKRATLLKNEVIGRVLYATMRTALENDENFVQETKEYEIQKLTIKNNSELSKSRKKDQLKDLDTGFSRKIANIISQIDFYNTDLDENKDSFMEYLFYTDFNNSRKDDLSAIIDKGIIKRMIELNPYTFDMLRDGNQIGINFYKQAYDNNYLFREKSDFDIIKKINSIKGQQPFSVIAQYMLNDIENNPKSDKFDATFAINIRRMLDEYFYSGDNKNDMVLFNIFRGIDAFLGKKYSIDAQEILDGNVRSLSNEIFDLTCQDKYNNYDRLCYSLFNLNRLAHDIHNISMKKLELDFNRYKNDSLDLNELQRILNSYEKLSRFGLMPKDMNFLFENNKRFAKMITDENFSTNQKTLLLNSILPETIKEIDDDDLDEIIECFEEIMNVDENVRNQIELDAEEQRMDYDAKRVVGEIFVRMLSEFASNSLDNQKEFFKKYGFVVECQYDVSNRENDLLVIYNPKFGKTFSIHMKDMDDDAREIFDVHRTVGQTRTLCCTQVNGGLVEFEQAFIENGKELIELSPSRFANSGDYPDRNLLNASVQFHNFLEYDCELYKEKIANANGNKEELKGIVLEIFKRVPIKNFDEVNIKNDNGDGTYSSTKILSLISDKIGIRLDTAIDTVNDIMSREENEKIVKFDDKYAGLVVHCLEQLNKKFLIADANYQKNELDNMMSEYATPGTDAVSQNKHI